MDALAADWDVTDEGPMEDLLGIEIDYLNDGSIKLHQTSYIRKLVERFCPDGHKTDASTKLPYTSSFLQSVADALSFSRTSMGTRPTASGNGSSVSRSFESE